MPRRPYPRDALVALAIRQSSGDTDRAVYELNTIMYRHEHPLCQFTCNNWEKYQKRFNPSQWVKGYLNRSQLSYELLLVHSFFVVRGLQLRREDWNSLVREWFQSLYRLGRNDPIPNEEFIMIDSEACSLVYAVDETEDLPRHYSQVDDLIDLIDENGLPDPRFGEEELYTEAEKHVDVVRALEKGRDIRWTVARYWLAIDSLSRIVGSNRDSDPGSLVILRSRPQWVVYAHEREKWAEVFSAEVMSNYDEYEESHRTKGRLSLVPRRRYNSTTRVLFHKRWSH